MIFDAISRLGHHAQTQPISALIHFFPIAIYILHWYMHDLTPPLLLTVASHNSVRSRGSFASRQMGHRQERSLKKA